MVSHDIKSLSGSRYVTDYLSMMNEPDGDNSAGTKIRLGYGIDDSQKSELRESIGSHL